MMGTPGGMESVLNTTIRYMMEGSANWVEISRQVEQSGNRPGVERERLTHEHRSLT